MYRVAFIGLDPHQRHALQNGICQYDAAWDMRDIAEPVPIGQSPYFQAEAVLIAHAPPASDAFATLGNLPEALRSPGCIVLLAMFPLEDSHVRLLQLNGQGAFSQHRIKLARLGCFLHKTIAEANPEPDESGLPRQIHPLDLASALANIGDAIITTTRKGRISFLNHEAERLTGWDINRAYNRPLHDVVTLVDEQTRTRISLPFEEVQQQSKMHFASILLIQPDESATPVSASATPIIDDMGQTRGMALIFHDISQQHEYTKALQTSEERFRLIVEGAVDYSLFMLTPEGLIESWNSGAERLKGYTASEVLGKPFTMFYTPEDLRDNVPQRTLDIARATGHYQAEGWRVRANGQRFWASVILTALYDEHNQLRGFSKLTRNMTEQKEAAEALRAERDRFQKIAETAAGVIHALQVWPDGRAKYFYTSPRIQEIFGLSSAELREDAQRAFERVYHSDRHILMLAINQSQQRLIPLHQAFRVQHPTRGRRWIDLHAIPESQDDGSAIWYGVMTDISDQKEAEQQLHRHTRRLQTIADIAHLLAWGSQNMHKMAEQVIHESVHSFEAACVIALTSGGETRLRVIAADGFPENLRQPIQRLLEDRPIDEQVLTRQVLYTNQPLLLNTKELAQEKKRMPGVAAALLQSLNATSRC